MPFSSAAPAPVVLARSRRPSPVRLLRPAARRSDVAALIESSVRLTDLARDGRRDPTARSARASGRDSLPSQSTKWVSMTFDRILGHGSFNGEASNDHPGPRRVGMTHHLDEERPVRTGDEPSRPRIFPSAGPLRSAGPSPAGHLIRRWSPFRAALRVGYLGAPAGRADPLFIAIAAGKTPSLRCSWVGTAITLPRPARRSPISFSGDLLTPLRGVGLTMTASRPSLVASWRSRRLRCASGADLCRSIIRHRAGDLNFRHPSCLRGEPHLRRRLWRPLHAIGAATAGTRRSWAG